MYAVENVAITVVRKHFSTLDVHDLFMFVQLGIHKNLSILLTVKILRKL